MANLDNLTLHGAEKLELRRLKINLIVVHKILFGLTDIDFNDYFAGKQDGATRGISGHKYCLFESVD